MGGEIAMDRAATEVYDTPVLNKIGSVKELTKQEDGISGPINV